jgi:hypothetical protein
VCRGVRRSHPVRNARAGASALASGDACALRLARGIHGERLPDFIVSCTYQRSPSLPFGTSSDPLRGGPSRGHRYLPPFAFAFAFAACSVRKRR